MSFLVLSIAGIFTLAPCIQFPECDCQPSLRPRSEFVPYRYCVCVALSSGVLTSPLGMFHWRTWPLLAVESCPHGFHTSRKRGRCAAAGRIDLLNGNAGGSACFDRLFPVGDLRAAAVWHHEELHGSAGAWRTENHSAA